MNKIVDILFMLARWYTRRRKPPIYLIGTGIFILSQNKNISNFLSLHWRGFYVTFGSGSDSFIAETLVPLVGVLFCMTGLVFFIIDQCSELKRNSSHQIILIQGEGLRKVASSGLDKIAMKELPGKLITLKIDITHRLNDGFLSDPEKSFRESVLSIISSIGHSSDGIAIADISMAYGGFLPVPFTFFIGNILDDKGNVTLFDWNRQKEEWGVISDVVQDDGDAFELTIVRKGTPQDVVLVVSCSYESDIPRIKESFPQHTIYHFFLSNISFDNHWSLAKQQRLSMQFVEQIKELDRGGAKRINLILAAQSSVVVSFGRRYDSRNMPELIVWQYERTSNDAYPWGVYALSHGRDYGGVVTKGNITT